MKLPTDTSPEDVKNYLVDIVPPIHEYCKFFSKTPYFTTQFSPLSPNHPLLPPELVSAGGGLVTPICVEQEVLPPAPLNVPEYVTMPACPGDANMEPAGPTDPIPWSRVPPVAP